MIHLFLLHTSTIKIISINKSKQEAGSKKKEVRMIYSIEINNSDNVGTISKQMMEFFQLVMTNYHEPSPHLPASTLSPQSSCSSLNLHASLSSPHQPSPSLYQETSPQPSLQSPFQASSPRQPSLQSPYQETSPQLSSISPFQAASPYQETSPQLSFQSPYQATSPHQSSPSLYPETSPQLSFQSPFQAASPNLPVSPSPQAASPQPSFQSPYQAASPNLPVSPSPQAASPQPSFQSPFQAASTNSYQSSLSLYLPSSSQDSHPSSYQPSPSPQPVVIDLLSPIKTPSPIQISNFSDISVNLELFDLFVPEHFNFDDIEYDN